LIQHGASINQADSFGLEPIHVAVQYGLFFPSLCSSSLVQCLTPVCSLFRSPRYGGSASFERRRFESSRR
jgi:hypothetical protein